MLTHNCFRSILFEQFCVVYTTPFFLDVLVDILYCSFIPFSSSSPDGIGLIVCAARAKPISSCWLFHHHHHLGLRRRRRVFGGHYHFPFFPSLLLLPRAWYRFLDDHHHKKGCRSFFKSCYYRLSFFLSFFLSLPLTYQRNKTHFLLLSIKILHLGPYSHWLVIVVGYSQCPGTEKVVRFYDGTYPRKVETSSSLNGHAAVAAAFWKERKSVIQQQEFPLRLQPSIQKKAPFFFLFFSHHSTCSSTTRKEGKNAHYQREKSTSFQGFYCQTQRLFIRRPSSLPERRGKST